jgi:glycerate 2-kinase
VSRVVVAPDSFKGSISAADAAAAIAAGWRDVRPGDSVLELPQADGGEGTLDAIAASIPDAVRRSAGDVTGPDGRPTPGAWLELPDGTVVVELAQMSGLALMERLDPLEATTRGLGETVAAALEAGASRLLIALGGSASTDGGRGALEALDGHTPVPTTLLTDVTAPLLGPDGAAAVFAPQKGATPAVVAALEERLTAWARRFPATDPATPGAGAAGGTAFGLLAAWHAEIRPGAPAIADLTGLTTALTTTDVLITGEGRLDATSFTGKVVGNALHAAEATTVTWLIAIAGQVTIDLPVLAGRATACFSLSNLAGSTEAALSEPTRWLRRAGSEAAASFN